MKQLKQPDYSSKMKNCFSMLILLLIVSPVHAEWIKVDIAAKNSETHYFDPGTILKDGSLRKIWVRSSYEEMQKGGFRAVKTQYEFDCQRHQARSVTMLLYPDRDATGDVIGAHRTDSGNWFSFSASSMFRHIEETVCDD